MLSSLRLLSVAVFLLAPPASAIDLSAISNTLPGLEKLAPLQAAIRADPYNLDHYFAYATMATQLREFDKSAAMYERMLDASPNLPRIQLELAMVYIEMREFEKAQTLMDSIMAGAMPEDVRANLEPILTRLATANQTHFWNGSVGAGVTYDSNTNAAPASDTILVIISGQELPFVLDGNSRATGDTKIHATASLSHRYTPIYRDNSSMQLSWRTAANFYKNEHDKLDELNVTVAALQTGPAFTSADKRLTISPVAGLTHIQLNGNSYQRLYSGTITAQYALDASTRLFASILQERRDFVEPTNNNRDGQSRELRAGGTYLLTQNDSLTVTAATRDERARQRRFDNVRRRIDANYLHQFGGNWYAGANAGWRLTIFNAPDTTISFIPRKEKEFSGGAVIGKRFTNNISTNLRYQYRDIDSNITNFSFDSHTVSTDIGWNF